MEHLVETVERYEAWLRRQCDVVEADLDAKHARMAADQFVFLRATYFRWAAVIPHLCPTLMDAPRVTCVGDVHVENYGTWRDADGRLVWGLNDFDEAASMPYTLDLVRLACSAALAPGLELSRERIAKGILQGYAQGLEHPGPVLPTQGASWYPALASKLADAAADFWKRFEKAAEAVPPQRALRALQAGLPRGASALKFSAVSRGAGSLGRPRFQVLASWQGGYVMREAKLLVPSAWGWAAGRSRRSRLEELAFGAFRSPDASLAVHAGFSVRRISPEARKLDVADVGGAPVVRALLSQMGAELASAHAAHRRSRLIAADLASRRGKWLERACEAMLKSIAADHAVWRAHMRKRTGQRV